MDPKHDMGRNQMMTHPMKDGHVMSLLQGNKTEGMVGYKNVENEWMRHMFLGVYLVILSLWLIFNTLRNYSSAQNKGVKFQVKAHFPIPSMPGIPGESCLKLAYMMMGIVMEMIVFTGTAVLSERMISAQHAMLYTAFALNAWFEVMQFYEYAVPKGSEVAMAIFAFAMEATMIYHDQLPHSPLYTTVHMFLFIATVVIISSMYVEVNYQDRVMPPLARGLFMLTHGTWSMHICLIVLSAKPTWDPFAHDDIMTVTSFFPWHCFLNLGLIMLAGNILGAGNGKTNAQADLKYHLLPTSDTADVITANGDKLVNQRRTCNKPDDIL